MHSERFSTLDGIRGLGCVAIGTIHAYAKLLHAPAAFWKTGFFDFAEWYVAVFFCLSGFLVFRSFDRRAKTERRYILDFYLGRIFRILPVWWIAVICLYALDPFPLHALIANLFLYFGFLTFDPVYLPIIPSWTLFIDDIFYITLPFLFPLLRTTTSVLRFLFFSILIAAAWHGMAARLGVSTGNYFIERFPLMYFPFLILGILFYQVYRNEKFTTWLHHVSGSGWIKWWDIFTLLTIGLLLLNSEAPSLFTVPLAISAATTPGTLVNRFTKAPVLCWLGVRCYGIYLYHSVIYHFMEPIWARIWMEIGFPSSWLFTERTGFFVLAFGLTVFVADLSYKWIEIPLVRFGRGPKMRQLFSLTNINA